MTSPFQQSDERSKTYCCDDADRKSQGQETGYGQQVACSVPAVCINILDKGAHTGEMCLSVLAEGNPLDHIPCCPLPDDRQKFTQGLFAFAHDD